MNKAKSRQSTRHAKRYEVQRARTVTNKARRAKKRAANAAHWAKVNEECLGYPLNLMGASKNMRNRYARIPRTVRRLEMQVIVKQAKMEESVKQNKVDGTPIYKPDIAPIQQRITNLKQRKEELHDHLTNNLGLSV